MILIIGTTFILAALLPANQRNIGGPLKFPTPATSVEMTNMLKFNPDTVRIKVGETVRWHNTSDLVHSVTGDPSKATIKGSAQLPEGAKPFNSGMMDPKATFTHTFTVAGTYKYFCIPHEGVKMYGWVIVKE
ncbi:MAG TPA: plastocyanin/azurin family copper-binding protein [Balneolaceae bacterium]|nr:plastocyanin/azurin family copper-binding protein [Balneolaceae bacterium]